MIASDKNSATFYPDGKKLLDLFGKGLKSLKQQGIYQEIIDRHLGDILGNGSKNTGPAK